MAAIIDWHSKAVLSHRISNTMDSQLVMGVLSRPLKAKKALTSLRTIANKLIRELKRKLHTHSLFETYQKDFLFYQEVLAQQPKDNNKSYSLHEPDLYAS
jgi:hypothetical protein